MPLITLTQAAADPRAFVEFWERRYDFSQDLFTRVGERLGAHSSSV